MPIHVEMLIQRMEWAAARGLTDLTETLDDSRIRIVRATDATGESAQPGPMPALPAAPQPAAAAAADEASGRTVPSPLAGLCHLSPDPGAAAFITVGQAVAAGQTLCLIEAMKVMTPVTAPQAGEVAAVLVDDGCTVEVGAPLVRLT